MKKTLLTVSLLLCSSFILGACTDEPTTKLITDNHSVSAVSLKDNEHSTQVLELYLSGALKNNSTAASVKSDASEVEVAAAKKFFEENIDKAKEFTTILPKSGTFYFSYVESLPTARIVEETLATYQLDGKDLLELLSYATTTSNDGIERIVRTSYHDGRFYSVNDKTGEIYGQNILSETEGIVKTYIHLPFSTYNQHFVEALDMLDRRDYDIWIGEDKISKQAFYVAYGINALEDGSIDLLSVISKNNRMSEVAVHHISSENKVLWSKKFSFSEQLSK